MSIAPSLLKLETRCSYPLHHPLYPLHRPTDRVYRSYVQFVFNASLTIMILTALFWFLWTIWGDVKDLRGVYSSGESGTSLHVGGWVQVVGEIARDGKKRSGRGYKLDFRSLIVCPAVCGCFAGGVTE